MAPASRTIDNVSGTALVPATQLAGRTRRCEPSSSYVPLQKKAGVLHIKFAAQRRNAATLLLVQGIHRKLVAEILGHTTISRRSTSTRDIYSHVTLHI